jgi:hypothetical protein
MVSSGIFYIQAQDKSKKAEIRSVVKSAFESKYPQAKKANWGVENPGEFEAEFQLNDGESSALFDLRDNSSNLKRRLRKRTYLKRLKVQLLRILSVTKQVRFRSRLMLKV